MLCAQLPLKRGDDSPVTYVSRGVHDRGEPRQAQAHRGALAGRAGDGDRAAVGLDDRLDDRQAEARAAVAVGRAAHEALEDARQRLGRDAPAAVGDLEHGLVAYDAASHGDAISLVRVLDGVLDDRVDRGDETLLVGAHGAGPSWVAAPVAV